jgi:hypothetical protein
MKTCSASNCISPVFSHGFCQGHQKQRTDDKYNRTYKSNKGIPKYTDKKRDVLTSFGFDDQISMFQALWEQAKDKNGMVVCPYTGERLNRFYNTDLWVNCFMHVLCKKNYRYFKLNPANIRIGFPDFHTLVDQGTAEQKAQHPLWRFDLWYNDVEKMKQDYASFKKKNLLA